MPQLRITKSSVAQLPNTERGQTLYFDTQLSGFGVCVGQRSKTYFARHHVRGRMVHVTIGRSDRISAEKARRRARGLIAQMADGTDPRGTQEARDAESLTLSEALDTYIEAKSLRPFTEHTYRRVLRLYVPDWANLPLMQISAEMVSRRHRRLAVDRGAPTANMAMRVIRAVYNYASVFYEGLPPNPVDRLTKSRTWFREKRRRSVIRPTELPAWFAAVMSLENTTARDYLRLLLFTGMRRSEALRLKWEDVDLHSGSLTVQDTKNYEALVLPLSDYLIELLRARSEGIGQGSWVFPGAGAHGHLQEPKKFIQIVRTRSGVNFTLHDLRRTFITIAESLDIPAYALKRLLNHNLSGDVTAGYIVSDVERLRRPMQQISDAITRYANANYEGPSLITRAS